jgi:cell division septum initiation protein DivIVA
VKVADNKFRSWVGFKEETVAVPTENAVERIRQLETQLADLRSRRDITSLSKEEFEILAGETAMSLIKTAQQRESRATSSAEQIVAEATRITKERLESSESKAKAILAGAETRGRKYLSAAESEAEELREKATRSAEHLLTESRREANALSSAAKREAERIISEATVAVGEFRSWLTSAISESERLYRVQTQSLNAAEQAIGETRSRLKQAFERLAALQGDIDANIDANNRPVEKSFVRSGVRTPSVQSSTSEAEVKKSATTPARKVVKKSTTKKRK